MTNPKKYSATPHSPCRGCPYRCDSPLGFWHEEHYASVLDADGEGVGGRVFECHSQVDVPRPQRGLCAGWLLDQRERNVPSIALRILLIQSDVVADAMDVVAAGDTPVMDAETMVKKNLEAIAGSQRRETSRRHRRPTR